MPNIDAVLQQLGTPYSLQKIDGEPVIYRDLKNGYDFEVTGVRTGNSLYSLYVWRTSPHKEIVGIYHGIHGVAQLKDALGYYAFRYQNLQEKIRVEREESIR